MLLTDIGNNIKRKVSEWLMEKGLEEFDVVIEIPSNPKFGDLSLPIAFKLARLFKKSPLEVAKEIINVLRNIPYLDHVEVAGRGYINIFLSKEKFYRDFIGDVYRKKHDFSRIRVGEGLVRIEYTSVNPNKALHIGHARNVVLGVGLSNLMSYVGYDVELLNYIDDTGSQMADLIIGFLYLGFDANYRDGKFDKYCGDVVYTESHRRIEESEELKKRRRDVLRLIEEGGNVVSSFSRMIAERVLRDQLRTCWRLGGEYDKLVWESDIIWSGMHREGFELIKKSRVVVYFSSGKYSGCWVAKLSEDDDVNPEVDDVLIRSDGTMTYVGKDSIFAIWKLGLLSHPLPFNEFIVQSSGRVLHSSSWPDGRYVELGDCNMCINIIGVEQSKQQNIIKKVVEGIYGEEFSRKYIHYYYNHVWLSGDTARKYLGMEVDSEAVKMSGRMGIYINVDDLLDEMKRRVSKIVRKNHPELPEEAVNQVAEKISVASLKYKLLSTDRDKVVVFDLDEALDITRESGAYILYSYARALSILRKAGVKEDVDFEFSLKGLNEFDHRLLRYLSLSPIVILDSARSLEIKPLVNYMYKLSLIFNEFYEKNPVIKAESEDAMNSRIAITKVYLIVLELFSKLTGIPLVEFM